MVQTDISSIVYVGNNSTSAPYPVPFKFFTDADLVVTVKEAAGIEELQILNTDYTVTGEGDPNGGALVMTWPVPATSLVSIVRNIEATQLTVYEEADAFPAKSHERALDKLTMLVQQSLRLTGSDPSELGHGFRLTNASTGISAVAKRNDTMLGLDAFGESILRTPNEMLAWLGQVSTVWQDTPERLLTRGAYAGQVGVQLDNLTIYIAQTTDPGDWLPFLIGTGIISATDGVPELLPPPQGDLVGTEQAQVLYNKTLITPAMQQPTGLTKQDVGLGNVDNTTDLNKPISIQTAQALAFKQDKDEKGLANGYAALDGAGKIAAYQIPDDLGGVNSVNGETGDVTLDKADVGLANVDNTSDANKPISSATQTALNAKQATAQKSQANGYASLDGGGKVPTAELPDSVVGASVYKGTWNAATNTPAIPAAAVGNTGWYFSVAVAGTTNINGINSWAVGDQIISNGTVWEKIPNVSAVSSVAGKTGAVTLVPADVGLANVDNTSDANKPVSTATQTALNLKEATVNKGVSGGYASLDGTGKVPAAQLPPDAVTSVNTKTGVVTLNKADVGLDQVDNTSDATKNSASVTLTNKTISGAANTLSVRLDADVTNNLPVGRLNGGTGASATTWWCGDGSWKQPSGTGDVNGPVGSADGEVALFSGTTGKLLRRFSGTAGAARLSATGVVTTGLMASDLTGTLIADQTDKAAPEIGDTTIIRDAVTGQLREVPMIKVALVSPPKAYINGLTTRNSTADAANDIIVGPGECVDSTNTYLMVISADFTKRLDAAWAAGSGVGGRNSGQAIADNTWHTFVIYNPTTKATDVIFSLTITGPNLPSGYTHFRRIGSFNRSVAAYGGISPFRQFGDYFHMQAPQADVNGQTFTPNQAAVMDIGFNCIVGLTHLAHFHLLVYNPSVSVRAYVGNNFASEVQIQNLCTSAAGQFGGTNATILIESDGLIWGHVATPNTGGSVTTIYATVLGYYDHRGQDGQP